MSILTLVSGAYALEIQCQGKSLEGDASRVVVGKHKACGLARYCNDGGKNFNNVRFARKPGTLHTWGVEVLPSKGINVGEEFFVSYGDIYWKRMKRMKRERGLHSNELSPLLSCDRLEVPLNVFPHQCHFGPQP